MARMEKFQISAWNQSDANREDAKWPSRNQESANLIHEVEELYNLDDSEWSYRPPMRRDNDSNFQRELDAICKAFYHTERRLAKVETKIKAPYDKVLAYVLYPPYGYRNLVDNGWGNPVTEVTEYLREGAAVIHYTWPEHRCCCCNVRGRDLVVLCGLKLKTPNTAIFCMKSIEHPSHPVIEGTYRVDMPLWGFYLEEQRRDIHMETFAKPINFGGSLGISGSAWSERQKALECTRRIPTLEDIARGEPPYLAFM